MRAPPLVTSRPEGWLQTPPHSSACAIPGRVCLQIQLLSRGSERRGATHAPWSAPPDFSVVRMEGWGWLRFLSALNWRRGLRAVCSRRKKLLQFWLKVELKMLSDRTFPVQASGCRLRRREAIEGSFPLGVSSVFGEGKRFDYVIDLARTPEQTLKDLKKI